MIRYAFFDVDGTLSVPRYQAGGNFVIGFPSQDWKRFCGERRAAAYEDCIPVLPVKRYAEKLKAQGVKLYVLTASDEGYEELAKKEFIRKNFPGLFEDVLLSSTGDEKTEIILEFAKRNHVSPEECELVEDTYMILLDAQACGIRPTHISSIVADL